MLKMEERAKLHLKEWLVAQVDSGQYEGLCWEDDKKTMFRIPWKHAAKKDYKETEDAALFKAWAVYKGKYREGRDKADPTMWKTRLRCALNKSTDFEEVPERNQLDITVPYKVYRIQHDPGSDSIEKKHTVKMSPKRPSLSDIQHHQPRASSPNTQKERSPVINNALREHMYCEVKGKSPSVSVSFFSPTMNITDFRLRVTLLYQGVKVMQVTTDSPDGCFILQGRMQLGNEKIYGTCTAQQVSFLSPTRVRLPPEVAEPMAHLLCHLEKGVLVWVAPDGAFIKRFCQGRVYWSGPLAEHSNQPNKLDREKTYKLLDVPAFLTQLQKCIQGKGPVPLYKIELCFGEEYPDPDVPKARKLIMAEVVPVFAEKLLQQFHLGEFIHFLTDKNK